MSSLFSKLCPFLRPEVMYGDTPLDISCFTTFISVQQYLTLCPPSHWIDRFMLISPLLAPAHSLINPPERNPGHDSQNDQASWIIIHFYFLWHPSRSFMTLFMSGQSSLVKMKERCVLRCWCHPRLLSSDVTSHRVVLIFDQQQIKTAAASEFNSSLSGCVINLSLSRQGLRGNRIFKILKGVKLIDDKRCLMLHLK